MLNEKECEAPTHLIENSQFTNAGSVTKYKSRHGQNVTARSPIYSGARSQRHIWKHYLYAFVLSPR